MADSGASTSASGKLGAEASHARPGNRHPVNRAMYDEAPLGARIADAVTGFMGSWRFIAIQTVIVLIWISGNAYLLVFNFDPFPFILLNLAFSTQAAYAAPMILLAQNRQADRDRAEIERDREINARSLADTDYLAREIAGIRLALERKPDRDDVTEALERLTRTIELGYGAKTRSYAGGSTGDDELGEGAPE